MNRLLSALALALTVSVAGGLLTACNTAYQPATGEVVSEEDRALTVQVYDRLREDPVTSDYTFGVKVSDGIVTLRGVVPDAGARARAVAVARGTDGVVGVVNELVR